MIGFSLNRVEMFELIDKIFQLSSIAFLRFGKFLFYVTANMLLFFNVLSLVVDASRLVSFRDLFQYCIFIMTSFNEFF